MTRPLSIIYICPGDVAYIKYNVTFVICERMSVLYH